MANIRLQKILRNRVDEIVKSKGYALSMAFIYIMLSDIFELNEFEIEEAITDGAMDKGIDAIFELEEDGENILYLIQAKYFDQNHDKTIDENTKNLLIEAVANYVLGDYPLDNLNIKLKKRVENYRRRLSEGEIDRVGVIFVTNGQKPGENINSELEKFKIEQDGQVFYQIYSEESLSSIFLPASATPVKQIELKIMKDPGGGDKTLLHLPDIEIVQGKVARVDICDLAEIVKNNPTIFNENVRAFQSIRNKVNEQIAVTLRDPDLVKQFVYLNNGVTLLCDNFVVKPGGECVVIDRPSIINGCQTASTIYEVYREKCMERNTGFVLVRIIKSGNDDIKRKIIKSSNTQTAVKNRDLISEDDIQKQLETQFLTLGYFYERKRGMYCDKQDKQKDRIIDLEKAAQAYMALYLNKPAEAKSKKNEIYKGYYEQIFNRDLTAEQLLVSYILASKFAEKIKEKRERLDGLKKSVLGNSSLHLLPLFREWVLKPEGMLLSEIEDNIQLIDNLFNDNVEKVMRKLDSTISIISKGSTSFNPQYFFKSADSLDLILNASDEEKEQVLELDLGNMRKQKDLRYYKPIEYSIDGSKFNAVKYWNDLFVELMNLYSLKNALIEGKLDFIDSGSRILLVANPSKEDKFLRKKIKNGLWLLTNYNSKYLSEFCSALAIKMGIKLVIRLRPTRSRIEKTYKKRAYGRSK